MKCRHCKAPLNHTFLDLGYAPPSNAYLTDENLNCPEIYYPLKVMVCDQCWLVQTEDFASVEALFTSEYAYFSSTSSSWLDHAKRYVDKMINSLDLNSCSHVIEIASNDGYLLKNFVAKGIPCLGIEPTISTAIAAEKIGIKVLREFFGQELGERLASEELQADLIIGNNVYAHVPDINDFTHGLKAALKSTGTITLEFPHLMRLIEKTQFDTVYHEHFSYLSLYSVNCIFQEAGLRVWDVEELPTHGGSLRVFGCHFSDPRITTKNVKKILEDERIAGLHGLDGYLGFQEKANKIKDDLLLFLIEQKKAGKKIAAYGAAAKGNTLLNYAGVKPDLLPYVFDAAPAKQGKFMPGSHIPILAPIDIINFNIDYMLILPWNIADEVKRQNSNLELSGVQFLTAVPSLTIS